MKIGDLVKVRHHYPRHNGNIGIITGMVERAGFRIKYMVMYITGDISLSLTSEQCEVINESR